MTIEKVRRLHKRLNKMGEVDPHYFDWQATGVTKYQEVIDMKKYEMATAPAWAEHRENLRIEKQNRAEKLAAETEAFMTQREKELAELDAEEEQFNKHF